MGISIYAADEKVAVFPRGTVLRLVCDGDHPDLPTPAETFEQDGYIAQRISAARAGWKFLADGSVLGPCCSGKKVVET